MAHLWNALMGARSRKDSAMDKPRQLPPQHYRRIESVGSAKRVVADYMAGMTDKFALEEHRKLYDPHEKV